LGRCDFGRERHHSLSREREKRERDGQRERVGTSSGTTCTDMSLRLPRGPSTRTGRVGCECDGFHRQGDEATASRQARHVFFTSRRVRDRQKLEPRPRAVEDGLAGGRAPPPVASRLPLFACPIRHPPAAVQGLPLLRPPRGWQEVMARLADRTAGQDPNSVGGSEPWSVMQGRGFGRVRGGFTAGTAPRLAGGCTDRYESPAFNSYV
jgi:hypothetical protein